MAYKKYRVAGVSDIFVTDSGLGTIENGGVALPSEPALNFDGVSIIASDDPANARIDVSAASGGIAFRGGGPIPNSTATQTAAANVYTRPYYIPSDVNRLTLRMANCLFNGPANGGVAITGVDIAVYASDGTGQPTGTALSFWSNQTIPSDNSFWIAPTSTPVNSPRSIDGKIVVCFVLPAGNVHSFQFVFQLNVPHGNVIVGGTAVVPAPAGGSPDSSPVFWILFDYRTSRPPWNVIGDSIAAGYSNGFENTAWYLLGPQLDYAVCMNVFGTATLADFTNVNVQPNCLLGMVLPGTNVWIQACVNSLPQGIAAMESQFTTIVNYVKAQGANAVVGQDCAPQNAYPGAPNEATRQAWNAYIPTQIGGQLLAAAQFAEPQPQGGMATLYDPTILYAPYSIGGGDLIHWNAVGDLQANTQVRTVVQYLGNASIQNAQLKIFNETWFSIVDAQVQGTTLSQAGNFTTGNRIAFSRVATVVGIRFYYWFTTAITFKLSLWDAAGTRQATGTVAIGANAPGVYYLVFGTPVTVPAYQLWTVSMWDTSGTGFYGATGGIGLPTAVSPVLYSQPAFFSAGDTYPVTLSAALLPPVEPIYSVTP